MKLPNGTGFRRDLFNCIDLIAVAGCDTIGIQATSATNHAIRISKSIGIPELKLWLNAGNIFLVISWKQLSNRRWKPRASKVTLSKDQLDVEPFPLK